MRRHDSRFTTLADLEGADALIDLVAISNDPSGEEFRNETLADQLARPRDPLPPLAKAAGVKRYVLPSSCSIYGFQDQEVVRRDLADQPAHHLRHAPTSRPSTDVLALADERASPWWCCARPRSTAFSPRMRFDLAINGMTYGACKTGMLPLMRDGSQWRPMVHVKDTAAAQIFMLDAPAREGGRPDLQRRLGRQRLPARAARRDRRRGGAARGRDRVLRRRRPPLLPGRPSTRSRRSAGGRRAPPPTGCARSAPPSTPGLDKDERTITLAWYRHLEDLRAQVAALELHGGMLRL